MSGIYAGTKYDALFQEELVTQSVRPNYYAIDNNTWDNNAKCVSMNGPRANRTGDTGEVDTGDRVLRVDVESGLARDYSDTKYMTGNTLEEKKKRLLEKVQNFNPVNTECSGFLDNKNSLLDIDNKVFRETAYDVTFNPIIDPREWVYNGSGEASGNNRFGRSSRYDTKLNLEDQINVIRNAASTYGVNVSDLKSTPLKQN
jgi:hypothetical protein